MAALLRAGALPARMRYLDEVTVGSSLGRDSIRAGLDAAGGQAPHAWLRAGYMYNSTRYTNRETGRKEPGNSCAYVLVDYQLRMPDPASPARGLFLGGTAMTVPSEPSPYDLYYEALQVDGNARGTPRGYRRRMLAIFFPLASSSMSLSR
jgi:hypothetical protein